MGYSLKEKCKAGFFSMPNWLYDGGAVAGLSPSAQVLLMFFYRVLNRASSPRFKVSESVIEAETGLAPNTISKARKELERAGLIQCERASSNGAPYVYHLINPETKEPFWAERERPAVYTGNVSAALQDADSTAARALRAPRPPKAKPIPIQKESPPVSAENPQNVAHHDGESVCYQHGNKSVWHRADGSSVCGECHPRPNCPEQIAPVTASPDMTKHGLFLNNW
jgi:hypothetical protein